MTNQEIFDRVATHLLTQKSRSVDDKAQCYYRSPDGKKCAIGCLIPDDLYVPSMEGRNVTGLKDSNLFDRIGIGPESLYLLQRLQRIHDEQMPDAWPRSLYWTAENFNLDPKVVERFCRELLDL